MLSLSRCTNEKIYLDVPLGWSGRIEVMVIRSSGNVNLGFTADRAVEIHRAEVADRIAAAGRKRGDQP